jgi:Fe-S cluster assembly protein SufD
MMEGLSIQISRLPGQTIIAKGVEKTLLVREVVDSTVVLEENAKLTFVLLGVNGWESLRKMTFEFVGKNSELQFLGFIIGTGSQTFPFETISKHLAPQTKAHYLLRAAMFDSSIVDYKGSIIIDKKAQLADTYLAHHTLLLSNLARARTIPALEIEADDVKAGHAATIGKVDDELMFYLKSRGINSKEAREMLISSFFEKQLQMIPDKKIQEDLRKIIKKSLPFQPIS